MKRKIKLYKIIQVTSMKIHTYDILKVQKTLIRWFFHIVFPQRGRFSYGFDFVKYFTLDPYNVMCIWQKSKLIHKNKKKKLLRNSSLILDICWITASKPYICLLQNYYLQLFICLQLHLKVFNHYCLLEEGLQ